MRSSEVGLMPGTIGATSTYGISIDTVKGVSVPANYTRARFGGVLECYITIEGSGGAGITGVISRYRWDGTNPTTTVGMVLAAPTEFTSATMVLVGEALINAFKIIGSAAGNIMSYSFLWRDTR